MHRYSEMVYVLCLGLTFAWGWITYKMYKKNYTWRAYGSALFAISYAILFYRNITSYNVYLTYIVQMLQVAGTICFIQVIRVLAK